MRARRYGFVMQVLVLVALGGAAGVGCADLTLGEAVQRVDPADEIGIVNRVPLDDGDQILIKIKYKDKNGATHTLTHKFVPTNGEPTGFTITSDAGPLTYVSNEVKTEPAGLVDKIEIGVDTKKQKDGTKLTLIDVRKKEPKKKDKPAPAPSIVGTDTAAACVIASGEDFVGVEVPAVAFDACATYGGDLGCIQLDCSDDEAPPPSDDPSSPDLPAPDLP